ncbi:uncharacterized protein [Miscanthus floridulus]|uniref:uncharacterized protein n=1 Tax=Miscanthus floridulus TaxID=154761 RepID=UPI00345782A9
MSDGGSSVMAASPSLLGAIAAIATAAALTLAMIPVPTVGTALEVTLAAPPPPVMVEEERETELPTSLGGGPPGSSLPPGMKAPEESAAKTESGRLLAVYANEVVDIPSDDEAGIAMGPPVSLWELAVVQSEGGPFGGLPKGDLEWAYPKNQAKAWFVLQDSRERQLWDILGEQGHAAVSELTNLSEKLGNAQRQTTELERRVESTYRESQDQAAKAATARAKGQCVAERATTAEQGLEAAKARQAETGAGLRASLANIEVVLQEALVALGLERAALVSTQNAPESARKALEADQKARSEADHEVLML